MPRILTQFFLLLCICSLVGCVSPNPSHSITSVDEAALPQKPDTSNSSDSIRSPGDIKVYPVGRYEDPEDPDVMHEAHSVYRQETSSQWNTAPNAPTYVPIGPKVVAAAVPDQEHISLTAELEQKVVRENQLLQTTYEQNEKLSQEIAQLMATGHLPVAVPAASSSPVATSQSQPSTTPSPTPSAVTPQQQ